MRPHNYQSQDDNITTIQLYIHTDSELINSNKQIYFVIPTKTNKLVVVEENFIYKIILHTEMAINFTICNCCYGFLSDSD